MYIYPKLYNKQFISFIENLLSVRPCGKDFIHITDNPKISPARWI